MNRTSALTVTRSAQQAPGHDRGDDWRTRAACLTEDPELFFPATGTESASRAVRDAAWEAPRAVCGHCPVRDACLAQSLDDGDTEGMFGGLTPDERRNLRRRRARVSAIGGRP